MKTTRRSFLRNLGGAVAVGTALGIDSHPSYAKSQQPGEKNAMRNILYIHTDQQRADAMRCMGNPAIQTPNLDRLAKEGMLFRQAYVCTGQCVPSRQATLTGRYPHANRVQWNSAPLADDELTVAKILNAHGYKSVAVGKMHFMRRDTGHGFDWRPIGSHAKPHGEYKEYLEKNNIEWTKYEFKNGNFIRYIASGTTHIPEEHYYTTYTANAAMEELEKIKDGPFCMWLGFNGPHHPHYPPEPWASMYDPNDMPLAEWIDGEFDNKPKCQQDYFTGPPHHFSQRTRDEFRYMMAKYYGFVSLIDKNVGRVLDKLDELGLRDNTIVIFTSDHGDFLGDHRLGLKSLSNYDSTHHVPFIIRDPQNIKPGRESDAFVNNVDTVPTLLDLMGIPEPMVQSKKKQGERRLLQGRSFAPLLREEDYVESDALFFEFGGNDMEKNKLRGIRTKKWKYTYNFGEVDELYNLEDDPREYCNLAADPEHLALINEMRGRILEWWLSTEDNRVLFPDEAP